MINKVEYSVPLRYVFLFLIFFFFSDTSIAQDEQEPILPVTNRVLFVLDASGSMHGVWESDMKINVAKKLLGKILDSLNRYENLETGLRVYGHQSPRNNNDCNDTKLEVPFAKKNNENIKQKLKMISPMGQTPIGYSLLQSTNDFPANSSGRNIIILITDGIESCNEDPCTVSLALQKKGIFLKPFVIGIGMDRDYSEYFKCVGSYFDASSETAFESVLGIVISQALNVTTSQVNLLDNQGNATETNVNMTFYDNSTGVMRYNYIHTINDRGIPDTITLDPVYDYDMVVHTLPMVKKTGIKLTSGKHNIIAVDAPRGSLELKVDGRSMYKNLQCIVKQADSCSILNLQDFLTVEKYLTGNYDLAILTMPEIYLQDVQISQSHVTTIEIPAPGNITIMSSKRGYGSIYKTDNNQMDWVCNLSSELTNQNITLQPGNYKVVFRSTYARKSLYTVDRDFQVISGAGASVKIY